MTDDQLHAIAVLVSAGIKIRVDTKQRYRDGAYRVEGHIREVVRYPLGELPRLIIMDSGMALNADLLKFEDVFVENGLDYLLNALAHFKKRQL